MTATRKTAYSIVGLMLISILASFGGLIAENQKSINELSEEPTQLQATSPGHPVWAEYMGAHWCGPCISATNNLKSLYNSNGDDFTFISIWESPTTGNPNDSPINRKSHIQSAPGYGGTIPVTVFGDADNGQYYAAAGPFDSLYTSGGGMVDANKYQLAVIQSENNGQMNIEITASYQGTGTKTVHLLAAVTESIGAESYSAGSGSDRPPHLWRKWLLNNAGAGFESFTLSSGTPVTKSWTVPVSLVRAAGGLSSSENFLTVAALLDGDHTSHRNVLSAADSNMAPLIDLGVKSFTASNQFAPNGGYVNGDIIEMEATVVNNGIDPYTDGGDVRFFHKVNNAKTYVGTTQTLRDFASTGATQTFSGQIDTTDLPESAYQTTFGIEISGLEKDKYGSNNIRTEVIAHDLVPVARKAQVIGNNQIERGDDFLVEAKTTFNDGVDTSTSDFTFELEISPTQMNQWIGGDMIEGGDQVFQEGTSNEHRQYLVKPSMNMEAGDYDMRLRATDSRMQTSDWQVTERGFTLKNAMPVITAEPIPTVKVQTSTKVSIIDNVNDEETPRDQLEITSSSQHFVAWHPATEEIEVYFDKVRYVGGEVTASGIEISVNDGTDTSFGTLLFNVIENGQPRWAGVEKQYVDEASSASLSLLPYLSDTDRNGNVAPTQDLVLAIVDNSNPDLLDLSIDEFTLNYATSNDDINGETTITVRASDGEQYSDQMIKIAITPINDAPRLDLSEFENLRLKVNTQKVIFLNEILTDVDGDVNEVTVTASNAIPGAARVNFLDNTLTMMWDTAGLQTVTIQTEDRYDSNIYTLVIDVYDSLPLLVGEGPDADVTVSVTNVYVGEIPQSTLFLNKDDVTITSISSTWQTCTPEYCMFNEVFEHDVTMKSLGWTFDPANGQVDGMGQFHYVKLNKITAQTNNGEKFEYKGDNNLKWTASDYAPGPDQMTKEELKEHIEELDSDIDRLVSEMETISEGTPEYEVAVSELDSLRAEKTEACKYTTCNDEASGQTADDSSESGLDLTVILIVIGVVIIALLAGIMFMRGGSGSTEEQVVDWANQLPANDAVANSMYGGAQEIFQQPVAAPAPAVVQQVPPGAPPLPPGGLPAGWTMEQWAYYGHQYQQ